MCAESFKNQDPIPNWVLERYCSQLTHRTSVVFMQPWDSLLCKARIQNENQNKVFLQAHAGSDELFEGQAQEDYKALKTRKLLKKPPLAYLRHLCRSRNRFRCLAEPLNRNGFIHPYVQCKNLWLGPRLKNLRVGWSYVHSIMSYATLLNIPRIHRYMRFYAWVMSTFFTDTSRPWKIAWSA